jgi:2-haloacid dehalogenase
VDLRRFESLTFDCYGTLIDWESGLLEALHPIFKRHGISVTDDRILAAYAELESAAEAGPYLKYRRILEYIVDRLGVQFGFSPSAEERLSLPESIRNWRPFPDTVPALRKLKRYFRVGVISNIDDDLFAATARHLEVPLDAVITAEQVGAYKPSLKNFEIAEELMGLNRDKWLHVAQSKSHDILPAKQLGIHHVWVNLQSGRREGGAVLPVSIEPEMIVQSLEELASFVG